MTANDGGERTLVLVLPEVFPMDHAGAYWICMGATELDCTFKIQNFYALPSSDVVAFV